ncbi:hypothetical protein [Brevundimonas sp.]|jgi:hypothetical protein|uniref:hypothetical protein n=1 Tax=Brevundimonas sp. TaxID=1871086 RepID=UPI0037BFDED2
MTTWTQELSREDAVLDRYWREYFDQPLPMRGAGQAMKQILIDNGLAAKVIKSAIRLEQRSWATAGQGGRI